jgi:predicted PurR-regulated permease PerM
LGGLTEDFFQNGGALLEQAAIRLPKLATAVLGFLSKGMLGLITGIISAYMISARMPRLRSWWQNHQPKQWQQRWKPLLKTMQKSLSGWVIAELKLALLGFGFMAAGFWLLGIRRSLVLAGLIAIVDAFPVLGVGTVLIPWALICLLRRQTVRGIGLLAVYAVVWLTRSILEPKLVGKGLGLDPLVTLVAIYAGWKLWGIGGMLLAPILALTVAQVLTQWRVES